MPYGLGQLLTALPIFQGKFIAKTITCVPLNVDHFQSDMSKFYQLLKNHLVYDMD